MSVARDKEGSWHCDADHILCTLDFRRVQRLVARLEGVVMRKSRSPARQLLSQILALGALISAVTLAPIRPSGAQEAAPSWSYTGSLNTARAVAQCYAIA